MVKFDVKFMTNSSYHVDIEFQVKFYDVDVDMVAWPLY